MELDKKSCEFWTKIFAKSFASEPQEKLTVLVDIADDYRGLKNYPEAIKYYEEFLARYSTNNANISKIAKIAEARKNLAYFYNVSGEYDKTIELYNF